MNNYLKYWDLYHGKKAGTLAEKAYVTDIMKAFPTVDIKNTSL